MGKGTSRRLADRDRIPHFFTLKDFFFHNDFLLQDHFAVNGADHEAGFFCIFEQAVRAVSIPFVIWGKDVPHRGSKFDRSLLASQEGTRIPAHFQTLRTGTDDSRMIP